ncbi:hypothetical protein P280DRAFT_515392 [Massarina eburnea CBS 473.64]|uniref:F-box domain-containing protein n=1 Tax=Massarina eburnea CBS 473.64 TaxID=1395130 RepID=A0A6A6S943_9PLEO|nr:hypothetical protein P280DRAFT_515392 [Massarina eburnea CBS 473.64]
MSPSTPSRLLALPVELLNQVIGELSRNDLIALLQVCKEFHSACLPFIFVDVTPLRVDRLSHELLDRLQEQRLKTRSLVLHYNTSPDILAHNDRTAYGNSYRKLDIVFCIYENITQLKTIAFTRTSCLDTLFYQRFQRFIETQSLLKTLALPRLLVTRTSTIANGRAPIDAIIRATRTSQEPKQQSSLAVYVREGSDMHTSRNLTNRHGHIVSDVCLFGECLFDNSLFDANSFDEWDGICLGLGITRPITQPRVQLHNLNANALHIIDSRTLLSLGIFHTVHDHIGPYSPDREESFFKDLIQKKAEAGNCDLQEFLYKQDICRNGQRPVHITEAMLMELLSAVGNMRVLCFHQRPVFVRGMAEFACLHANTLEVFSWRCGEDDVRIADIVALSEACPNIVSLGLTWNTALVPRKVPYHGSRLTRRDYRAKANRFVSALKGLRKLTTLCLFTRAYEGEVSSTPSDAFQDAMEYLAGAAYASGISSLKTIHIVHRSQTHMDSRMFKPAVSFRVRAHRVDSSEILFDTSVSIIENLPLTAKQLLQSLGGGHECLMKDFESSDIGYLFPSFQELVNVSREEELGPRPHLRKALNIKSISDIRSTKTPNVRKRPVRAEPSTNQPRPGKKSKPPLTGPVAIPGLVNLGALQVNPTPPPPQYFPGGPPMYPPWPPNGAGQMRH